MRITAAVVREAGSFVLEDVDLDEPRADEVLVRMVATGVCHTDLMVRDGKFPPRPPVVVGHEGAGIVERVGSRVTKVGAGDHVVLTMAHCGTCVNCKSGQAMHCTTLMARNFSGARSDGSTPLRSRDAPIGGAFFAQSSFATFAIATEGNVVSIRKDVPLELMGPLGCGVQTGAGAVLNSLRCPAGASLAIFGTGGVGAAAVLGAVVAGCTTIVAVDPNASRRELVAELGATHTVDPKTQDPVDAVRRITAGGAGYSIDTTGLPEVARQAVDCLGVPGACALVGIGVAGSEVRLDMFSLLMGRTVRGVVEGDSIPDVFIPALIELWALGRFPFDRLLSFYDFADINQAAADAVSGVAVKPVVRMP